ncbi:MAG: pre-peptidase C-terminal domain-containing protein [Oscillatoria sp. PMC 1068.18]|nr:pre-peptidase C-terminal domain-containing protein [Oscillatoria sp. PMC 1076.18]MEC4990781.1 pre-peptidase C-terminal domain-containing protein [Oscillatoria sp. PMC 1068.18]
MIKLFACRWYLFWFFSATLLTVGLHTVPVKAQTRMYNPVSIPTGDDVPDTLSEKDIPTGEGGFFRDYMVELKEGDQVAIDLLSDEFDTIVTLIADDGSTVAENDDGPDGSTNSLLFARINESGSYMVRVRAFGETGGGKFTLKVTRLRPVN